MQEVNLRNSSVVSDETRCQRRQTLSANWTKTTQRRHGRANHVSLCMCCHRVKLNTKVIQRTEYETSRVLCSIHGSYKYCHGSLRNGNCTCFNKFSPNNTSFHHQLCMIRLCLLAKLLMSAVIRRVPRSNTFKIWKLSTNYFFQRMHYLLKHKILHFVFKCFT
jgi:hypothetical protein